MPICPHCLMVVALFLVGLPGIGFLIRLGLRYLGSALGRKCKGNCEVTSTQVCECCEHELAEVGSFLCSGCLERTSVDLNGSSMFEDQDTMCPGSETSDQVSEDQDTPCPRS